MRAVRRVIRKGEVCGPCSYGREFEREVDYTAGARIQRSAAGGRRYGEVASVGSVMLEEK